MSEPVRILTVCTGNICRSPAAERALAHALGAAATVSSAGTHALVGNPVEPAMAQRLVAGGVSPDGFAARLLSEQIVDGAELVLTMEKAQRALVLEAAPLALKSTFTLLEFAHLASFAAAEAGGETPADRLRDLVTRAARARASAPRPPHGYDVPDPYRRDDAHFDNAWALIRDACQQIAAAAGAR